MEWESIEFDKFIGQPRSRFITEIIHKIQFTKDFTVLRVVPGVLKTRITVRDSLLSGKYRTEVIEMTTSEALCVANMLNLLNIFSMYKRSIK